MVKCRANSWLSFKGWLGNGTRGVLGFNPIFCTIILSSMVPHLNAVSKYPDTVYKWAMSNTNFPGMKASAKQLNNENNVQWCSDLNIKQPCCGISRSGKNPFSVQRSHAAPMRGHWTTFYFVNGLKDALSPFHVIFAFLMQTFTVQFHPQAFRSMVWINGVMGRSNVPAVVNVTVSEPVHFTAGSPLIIQ